MPTSPRIFDAWRCWEELAEKIADLTANRYDPSAVVVLGSDADQATFKQQVEEACGNTDFLILPAAMFDECGEIPFSLRSERDTRDLTAWVHEPRLKFRYANGDKKGEEGELSVPVHTVVSLYMEGHEKYLPLLLQKCPKLSYYCYRLNLPDESGREHAAGIFAREELAGCSVELNSQLLSQVKSESIAWLYPGYLPRAMHITMFAPKGRGKTKVSDYFTAKISSGCDWDDGTKNPNGPLHVLRFNLEDPLEQIFKPGLHAAGANLDLVEHVSDLTASAPGEPPAKQKIDLTNPAHIAAIKKKIQATGAALAIFEPINNYKGKAQYTSEDDMRPIHMALSEVAKETGACIVGVNHANKKKDVDVLEKSLGAGSGTAVARANFFLEKNPDNKEERILSDAGSNIPVGKSLVFIIKGKNFELDGVEHKDVGYAEFVRTDDITAEEVLERAQSPDKNKSKSIEDWLTEFLRGKGEVNTDQVKMAAHNHEPAWSWDLIKKVFTRRKVGSSRTEGGGKNQKTFWSMGDALPLVEEKTQF